MMLAFYDFENGSMDTNVLSYVIPVPPGVATRRAFGSRAVRFVEANKGFECTPEVPFPVSLYNQT